MQFLAAISLEIIDFKMKIIVDVLSITVIGKPCISPEIITVALWSPIFYFIFSKSNRFLIYA